MARVAQSQAPQLLTVAEVVDFPHVSKTTVYRTAHTGKLPTVRVECSLRVPLKAVGELFESNLDSWVIGDESEAAAQ